MLGAVRPESIGCCTCLIVGLTYVLILVEQTGVTNRSQDTRVIDLFRVLRWLELDAYASVERRLSLERTARALGTNLVLAA